MNNLIPYYYSGKTIRLVVDESGRIWWIGQDVCVELGVSKYRDVLSTLDSNKRMTIHVDTSNGNQEMTAVNELGLNHLFSLSNKERVQKFKRWVFHDVFPKIPKTNSQKICKYRQLPLPFKFPNA